MMDVSVYKFDKAKEQISPALIYYKDFLIENVKKAVEVAGDPQRMWPHVKTHKTREVTRILIKHGVTRFKCATIAEAEVTASCEPTDVILAYPLVGPNINRFIALEHAFPEVRFWAISDSLEQLKKVGEAAVADGHKVRVLVDVNGGMNRTGVALDDTLEFFEAAAVIEGLSLEGIHCYDGNNHQKDFTERCEAADKIMAKVYDIRDTLAKKGFVCDTLVMGGTPTFPCYARHEGVFVSPGTFVLNDYSYYRDFKDQDFIPAGLIMARVVSRPTPTSFTIDLGYKGISSDRVGIRGIIVGMEEIATPLFQSEEHWAFQIAEGHESEIPEIGEEVFVIPSHICPCSALYPTALIVSHGKLTEQWDIVARNRKIHI